MLRGGFGAGAPELNSLGLDYRGGQGWDSCGEKEKDMQKRARGQSTLIISPRTGHGQDIGM